MAANLPDGLSYADQGTGDPIVLLHGFPLDRRIWDGQIAKLSQRYRVIAPNLRGFGQSPRSDPFTIESLADDIHLFIDQLAARPCVLAGLSMGGYVALAYVRKYAQDLRGLILVDTKSEADDAKGREARGKMIDLVRSSGADAVAAQMLPRMLAPAALLSRPDVVKQLRTIMENCPGQTIEYALGAMRDRPDRTSELSLIKVPTLVIVGDADVITPPEGAQKMAEAIVGAKFEVIRGAGHMSPMEQPEQVNRVIERFLASL